MFTRILGILSGIKWTFLFNPFGKPAKALSNGDYLDTADEGLLVGAPLILVGVVNGSISIQNPGEVVAYPSASYTNGVRVMCNAAWTLYPTAGRAMYWDIFTGAKGVAFGDGINAAQNNITTCWIEFNQAGESNSGGFISFRQWNLFPPNTRIEVLFIAGGNNSNFEYPTDGSGQQGCTVFARLYGESTWKLVGVGYISQYQRYGVSIDSAGSGASDYKINKIFEPMENLRVYRVPIGIGQNVSYVLPSADCFVQMPFYLGAALPYAQTTDIYWRCDANFLNGYVTKITWGATFATFESFKMTGGVLSSALTTGSVNIARYQSIVFGLSMDGDIARMYYYHPNTASRWVAASLFGTVDYDTQQCFMVVNTNVADSPRLTSCYVFKHNGWEIPLDMP